MGFRQFRLVSGSWCSTFVTVDPRGVLSFSNLVGESKRWMDLCCTVLYHLHIGRIEDAVVPTQKCLVSAAYMSPSIGLMLQ